VHYAACIEILRESFEVSPIRSGFFAGGGMTTGFKKISVKSDGSFFGIHSSFQTF